MTTSVQSRLNRKLVLRYDLPHTVAVDSASQAPGNESPVDAGNSHMDVQGPGSVSRAYPAYTPRPAQDVSKPPTTAPNVLAPSDEVEISSAGRALEKLGQSSELRQARLDQIKQAIADGTYDTEEKFQAALERLLGEHGLSD